MNAMSPSVGTPVAQAPAHGAATTAAVWALRATSVLNAALMVAQPILIGRFLEGDFGSLAAHQAVGGILTLTATLVLVAAVLALVPGRLGAMPLAVAGALWVLVPAQLALGSTRLTSMHIPLGVALVAGSVWFAGWACTPGRARRTWRGPRVTQQPVAASTWPTA